MADGATQHDLDCAQHQPSQGLLAVSEILRGDAQTKEHHKQER